MQNREAILDILRKSYQIEVDGHTFYAMTASKASKVSRPPARCSGAR